MSSPDTPSPRWRRPFAAVGGGIARFLRKRRWSLLSWSVAFVAVYGTAAWAGHEAGAYLMQDQPSVRDLQHHSFSLSSKVFDSSGELIYTFAEEKRDYASYDQISPWVIQGLVAVEDEQFWDHVGLNFQGIARAAVADARASLEAGRLVFPEGGSSITQQLAKQLFLTSEKKFSRKIQEALLALHIEKSFQKEEILELYLNHVFLGHHRYGVEAAARYYFGKPAVELSLPEAALLAGMPQRPSALSPKLHPEAAVARRNHVLSRMAQVGYITAEQLAEARATPLELVGTETRRRLRTQQSAPYFVEDIRRQLVENHGDLVNTGGLEIETTIDMDLQRAATRAVREGLRRLDKELNGFRPIEENVIDEGTAPADFEHPHWLVPAEEGDVVPGVVLDVSAEAANVRVGEDVVTIGRDAVKWTKKRDLTDVLRAGDLAPFRVGARDEQGRLASLELEQDPELEAALVAIDVASGEVVAMVGGYDYNRSEYNKASQARRQVGSAFKPLYYAVALEQGLTPATTIIDEPTVFIDPWNGEQYAPKNYHYESGGRVTLREALERSLNVASVRLLNHVGYEPTIRLARRMGIEAELRPYPSLALGAQELTLVEITAAYATFPNMGLRVRPTLVRTVRDPKGNLIDRHVPAIEEILSPEAAFQTSHMLRGVIQHGTGKRARSLGRPVAGKTGTTDDYSDAWFVGFTPSLAVGVWVGHEKDLEPIGRGYAGAKAALPIWIDFLEEALRDRPVESFVNPGGVDFVPIDRATGLRASDSCPRSRVFLEAFQSGRSPARACTPAHHEQLDLPQCLHRFPLDVNGVLVVDERMLMQLEEERADCRIYVDPIRRVIELPWSRTAAAERAETAWSGDAWSSSRYGAQPAGIPYRLQREVWGMRWPEDSVEGRMALDRRQLQRTAWAGLSDFDVLGGKTVVIVRNEGGR